MASSRFLLAAVCAVSSLAVAEPKPAAVQLCVQLPLDEPLFVKTPGPHLRAVAKDVFMLDVDVRFDGAAPLRLTRVSDSCFRAWVAPRKVRRIELDFDRLSQNFVARPKDVSLDLKSDLWFDAGTFVVEQEPFAQLAFPAGSSVRLERQGRAGVVEEDASRLPAGTYRLTFTPPQASQQPCRAQVEVTPIGSVTPERQPVLFRELSTHYEHDYVPDVLKKVGMTCADDEVAVVRTKLVDGLFVKPHEPVVTRQRVSERETRYVLRHEGGDLPLEGPIEVTVKPGQHLEVVAMLPEHARPVVTPEVAAAR
ncbi:MAG: hypothetical protein SFW67_17695 [Myxococcaceae bacterium]|nr:hypothetical protein [Myxococcaceae bacterium]